MKNKFAENDYIQLWTENGILYTEFKPDTNIELPVAIEIMDLFVRFCSEESYPVLQDVNNLRWIDKRSRDFFANHPLTSQMKAWAYVSGHPIHKTIFTIFITFSMPGIPSEFFTERNKALDWLKNNQNLL